MLAQLGAVFPSYYGLLPLVGWAPWQGRQCPYWFPEGGIKILGRDLRFWSWHSCFLCSAGCLRSGLAFSAADLLEAVSLFRLSCRAARL
jgi:hypothetical protein